VAIVHEGRILISGSPGDLLDSFPHVLYRVAQIDRNAGKIKEGSIPEFIIRTYPSGGDLTAVAKKSAGSNDVAEWLHARFAGANIEARSPVMEDVFIERLAQAGQE
jgi:hypothetical protein